MWGYEFSRTKSIRVTLLTFQILLWCLNHFIGIELEVKFDFENGPVGGGMFLFKLLNHLLENHANIYKSGSIVLYLS